MSHTTTSTSPIGWRIARYTLGLGLTILLLSQLQWFDYACIPGEGRVRVIDRTGDAWVLDTAAGARTIPPLRDPLSLVLGLRTILMTAQWQLLGLAFSLSLLNQILSSTRWQLLMISLVGPVRFLSVLAWLLRSQAVATLPIGVLGLDAVRIGYAAKATGQPAKCCAVVMIERVIGLVALLLIGVLAAGDLLGVSFAKVVTCTLIPACIALWVGSRTSVHNTLTRGLTRHAATRRLVPICLEAHKTLQSLVKLPIVLVAVAGLSTIMQFTVMIQYYVLARSLGVGGPLGLYLVAVTVASIALALPNLGGLFVLEGSMAAVLTTLGDIPLQSVIILCAAARLMGLLYQLIPLAVLTWSSTSQESRVKRETRADTTGAAVHAGDALLLSATKG